MEVACFFFSVNSVIDGFKLCSVAGKSCCVESMRGRWLQHEESQLGNPKTTKKSSNQNSRAGVNDMLTMIVHTNDRAAPTPMDWRNSSGKKHNPKNVMHNVLPLVRIIFPECKRARLIASCVDNLMSRIVSSSYIHTNHPSSKFENSRANKLWPHETEKAEIRNNQ